MQAPIFAWDLVDHSGFAPENLTTLPHFSVFSAINFPKSVGEPASTVPPRSARRAFSFGSARPALISLLRLSLISAGAFLGAPPPYHPLASKPGRTSSTDGSSGNAGQRVALVTARARTLPVRTYSIEDGR